MYHCTIYGRSLDVVYTAECHSPPGGSVVATDEASGAVSVHSFTRVMYFPFLSVTGKVAHTGLGDYV